MVLFLGDSADLSYPWCYSGYQLFRVSITVINNGLPRNK